MRKLLWGWLSCLSLGHLISSYESRTVQTVLTADILAFILSFQSCCVQHLHLTIRLHNLQIYSSCKMFEMLTFVFLVTLLMLFFFLFFFWFHKNSHLPTFFKEIQCNAFLYTSSTCLVFYTWEHLLLTVNYWLTAPHLVLADFYYFHHIFVHFDSDEDTALLKHSLVGLLS